MFCVSRYKAVNLDPFASRLKSSHCFIAQSPYRLQVVCNLEHEFDTLLGGALLKECQFSEIFTY